jgi:hypothetical protein
MDLRRPALGVGEKPMKTRIILFALIAAAVSVTPAQTLNPARKYVEGTSDVYSMKMAINSSMGELGMTMTMTQKIVKVYENGDADIETATSDMLVNMGGQEIRPPSGKPESTRLSKFGFPVAPKKGSGMDFSRFGTYFGEKELAVGETYTFDQVEKENPKNHAKGTAKLLSIENGKAKLAVSVDSYKDKVEKPMHLDGTVTVDAATCKMLRFEGKASDLPAMGQGMTVSSAQFTIEKK